MSDVVVVVVTALTPSWKHLTLLARFDTAAIPAAAAAAAVVVVVAAAAAAVAAESLVFAFDPCFPFQWLYCCSEMQRYLELVPVSVSGVGVGGWR